jgi:transcriptional regulator with XRE-family HTH domain
MVENGDTQKQLAKEMGVSENALMWKLQGKYDFKTKEIEFIGRRYNLTVGELCDIFFGREW